MNKKIENKLQKENDIRRYYRVENDREESTSDENDRVMVCRNEDNHDEEGMWSIQTPQNDIENDCDAIQQPSTSKNLFSECPIFLPMYKCTLRTDLVAISGVGRQTD